MTSGKLETTGQNNQLPLNTLLTLFADSYLATARQKQIGDRRRVGTAVCVHYDYYWGGQHLTADNFFLSPQDDLTAVLAAIHDYKPATENQIFIPHINDDLPQIMARFDCEDRGPLYLMERPITDQDQDLTPAYPVQQMNSTEELKHYNGILGGSYAARVDVLNDQLHFYYLLANDKPVAQGRSWHCRPFISWESQVNTDPRFQRKGYGTAIMQRLLMDNADVGIKSSALMATEAGFRLYRRVGYTNRLKYGCYKLITKDEND